MLIAGTRPKVGLTKNFFFFLNLMRYFVFRLRGRYLCTFSAALVGLLSFTDCKCTVQFEEAVQVESAFMGRVL